jgi:hypothetical protein
MEDRRPEGAGGSGLSKCWIEGGTWLMSEVGECGEEGEPGVDFVVGAFCKSGLAKAFAKGSSGSMVSWLLNMGVSG